MVGVKRSGFRLLQSEDTANMKTLRGMPLPQKPHPAAVKIFCLQGGQPIRGKVEEGEKLWLVSDRGSLSDILRLDLM